MRTSRFSEEQIALALRQAEAGTPVREVCRKLGVSEATFRDHGRVARCSPWPVGWGVWIDYGGFPQRLDGGGAPSSSVSCLVGPGWLSSCLTLAPLTQ